MQFKTVQICLKMLNSNLPNVAKNTEKAKALFPKVVEMCDKEP